MPSHNRQGGQALLQLTAETDFPGADTVAVDIGAVAVLAAQLHQLPHKQVGFIGRQLVECAGDGMNAIVAVVVDVRLHTFTGVVGDGDVDVSPHVFHPLFLFPWNNYSIHLYYVKVK